MDKEEFFGFVDKGITVVDFFAEWCAPCKGQTVVFDYLKKDASIDDVKFLKFDVDKNDQDVVADFEIRNIPTIIIFNNGQEMFRFIGVTGSDKLMKTIKVLKKLRLND